MGEHIQDFSELTARIGARPPRRGGWRATLPGPDAIPFAGVEVVDRYSYRIRVKGKYPQFAYWLAMPFFAPMPWEAEHFYDQPGMKERNLTLDWYPVGTGPFISARTIPTCGWS